jgi:hypothetical protein
VNKWSREIEEDFRNWLIQNRDRLEAPKETIDQLIREGTR